MPNYLKVKIRFNYSEENTNEIQRPGHHCVITRMNADGKWVIEDENFYFYKMHIESHGVTFYDYNTGLLKRFFPMSLIHSIESTQ